MSEKDKKLLGESAVAAILLLITIWGLMKAFGGSSQPQSVSDGVGTVPVASTVTYPDYDTEGAYSPPVAANDSCCGTCASSGGCPTSSNTIQTINQMVAQGNAAAAQITAMGNATLQAITDAYTANNPLLQVTVG